MLMFCRCSEINKYKLYPWIHQFSNNRRSADQIRPIFFPDVDPHSLPPGSNFSMTAGDFQEIYSECSKFNASILKVLSFILNLMIKFYTKLKFWSSILMAEYKVYFSDNLK